MIIHHVILINTKDLLMPPIITQARARVVWLSGRGRFVDRSPEHQQSTATNQSRAGRRHHCHHYQSLKRSSSDLLVDSTWAVKLATRRDLTENYRSFLVVVMWRRVVWHRRLISDSLVMILCLSSSTCPLWKLTRAPWPESWMLRKRRDNRAPVRMGRYNCKI